MKKVMEFKDGVVKKVMEFMEENSLFTVLEDGTEIRVDFSFNLVIPEIIDVCKNGKSVKDEMSVYVDIDEDLKKFELVFIITDEYIHLVQWEG